jgi:hypothetical protein
MNTFEKLAVDSRPFMRLAVRLRRMYGWDAPKAIKASKKIEKAMSGWNASTTNNRVDILQRSLENAPSPLQRVGKVGPYSPWSNPKK